MSEPLLSNKSRGCGDVTRNGYNTIPDNAVEKGREEDLEEATRRTQAQNLYIMYTVVGFASVCFTLYDGAYTQWIYVRFEEAALGANFSRINNSAADDPCFRDENDPSHVPYQRELEAAQAAAAKFGILLTVCNLVPSFFTNIILGCYSDRIGRRLIFIVPLLGLLTRVAVVYVVARWDLNVYIVLVGAFAIGVCGDRTALYCATYIYTADNSSGKGRGFAMVIAQAVINASSFIAQFCLGYFIVAVGYAWPMFTGLCFSVVAFLVCFLFLRETLDQSMADRDRSLWRGIKGVFSFYVQPPQNSVHRVHDFRVLGSVAILLGFALASGVMTLYLMKTPLCWGSKKQAHALSITGLGSSGVSVVMLYLMKKRLSDEICCSICLLSIAVGCFTLAFASHDWEVYTALAVGFMRTSALPLIIAIMSKMVPQEKRGKLLSSLAVIEVVTVALATAGESELYAVTVTSWPGLTFFVLGCVLGLAACIMIFYKIWISHRHEAEVNLFVGASGTLSVNKGNEQKPPENA